MYYSKNRQKSKQLRVNCIFQVGNHNSAGNQKSCFLIYPEWTAPEKILKSRGVATGYDLGKRAEFSITECLAGSCIVWRVSVGWKAVFAGLRIVILRSVVFCRIIRDGGWFLRLGKGLRCTGSFLLPGTELVQCRGIDDCWIYLQNNNVDWILRKKGFLFAGKYGTTEQQKPSYHWNDVSSYSTDIFLSDIILLDWVLLGGFMVDRG